MGKNKWEGKIIPPEKYCLRILGCQLLQLEDLLNLRISHWLRKGIKRLGFFAKYNVQLNGIIQSASHLLHAHYASWQFSASMAGRRD